MNNEMNNKVKDVSNDELFNEMATEMYNESSTKTYDDLISQFEEPEEIKEEEPSQEEILKQQRERLRQQVKITDKSLYEMVRKSLMNFPQELKDLEIWCNWRFADGKKDKDGNIGPKRKVPVNSLTGDNARSNDPDTWADFDSALKRISNSPGSERGLGLMLTPPYIGIDLDDIKGDVDRHIVGDFEDNIVSEFVDEVDSYIETSPSGTGVHMIAKGILPEGRRKRDNVEMYNTTRFFTVTGRSIGPNYIKDDTDIGNIPKLHEKYLQMGDPVHVKVNRKELSNEVGGNDLTDEEVVKKISASKQGEVFKLLYDGDFKKVLDENGKEKYPSDSEADLGFANILAFWTGKDGDQMDRIFRSSGMMRAKWDEMRGHATYGDITIDKAIVGAKDSYTPKSTKSQVYEGPNNVKPFSTEFKTFKDEWVTNRDEPIREDGGKFPIRTADDTGNTERLLDRYGDILKFHFAQDKFYIYNGQFWKKDDNGLVDRLCNYTVNGISDEDWTEGISQYDENSEKAIEKKENGKADHITRSRSRASKTNMRELVKAYVPVTDDDFDQDSHLINTTNGYIDLRDGNHHKHDKDKLFSMMADGEFVEEPETSKWLNFLNRIFEGNQELIDFVQRCAGYSLTGNINEEVLFFLVGNGGNGKSTFLETLKAAMGTYTGNLNVGSLGVKKDSSVNNDLAKLYSSRLVTTSEPSKGFRFDEGLIKDMTGGEKISTRFLFNEYFDYLPQFKLWIATNHKPVIEGDEDGIWRRFMIIPFNAKFEGKDKNDRLKQELREELPSVLNWAIEGAVEWYKTGLNAPDIVTEAVNEYRSDMDIVGQFIEDHCDIDPEGHTLSSDLWDKYTEWVDKNRFTSLNRTLFGQELGRRYEKKQVKGKVAYVGIKLRYE